jgi:hypothetical protein
VGHMVWYFFVDYLGSENGVEWGSFSLVEVQSFALKQSYSGAVRERVHAFPPKPSHSVLVEREKQEQFSQGKDAEISF